MHGGECFAVENLNARLDDYDVSGIDFDSFNQTDPWDAALHDAAKQRFYADIARYNVTNGLCREVCSSFADSFPDSTRL